MSEPPEERPMRLTEEDVGKLKLGEKRRKFSLVQYYQYRQCISLSTLPSNDTASNQYDYMQSDCKRHQTVNTVTVCTPSSLSTTQTTLPLYDDTSVYIR